MASVGFMKREGVCCDTSDMKVAPV